LGRRELLIVGEDDGLAYSIRDSRKKNLSGVGIIYGKKYAGEP
jgi:hypothetical protein